MDPTKRDRWTPQSATDGLHKARPMDPTKRDRWTPLGARPMDPTLGATNRLHLGRDRWTPLGARPMDPAWGATDGPRLGRDRWTPLGARPMDPTWGATDGPHLGRDRWTPLGARPMDPTWNPWMRQWGHEVRYCVSRRHGACARPIPCRMRWRVSCGVLRWSAQVRVRRVCDRERNRERE